MSANLIKAVNSGNLDQIKRVLDADTSKKDLALLRACFKGNADIVKSLLEMGANPNVAAQSKATPLGLSVAFPAVVKTLLQHGANPNQVTNENGDTPLFHAVTKNIIPSIIFLMNAGADVNHKNSTNSTPFLLANEYKMYEICIKMLDKGANPNELFTGISSLQLACAESPTPFPFIKKLLEKGADPNYMGELGKTPLHMAVIDQNKELIELLLEHGADISIRDTDKHTPFYYAGPLQYLFYPFPNEYNSIPTESGNENSLQEDIEDGNILALLDPGFPEQQIVVKRKGKVTPGWKYLFEERKNPLTRQNVNLSSLTFKRAVTSKSNNKHANNRKSRKSRKSRKNM